MSIVEYRTYRDVLGRRYTPECLMVQEKDAPIQKPDDHDDEDVILRRAKEDAEGDRRSGDRWEYGS